MPLFFSKRAPEPPQDASHLKRAVLGKLTLEGRKFRCPTDAEPSIAKLIGDWLAYAEQKAAIGAVVPDGTADIHALVVGLLRSVSAVAKSEADHPVVAKCQEYFSYFLAKSSEYGTDLSTWDQDIRFARRRREAERVTSEVVREILDHLLTFTETYPGGPRSPVAFIVGEDDLRKQRRYNYFGNDLAMVETHFDSDILVDLQDLSLTPALIKTGWWEPWIDILLHSTLRPGMTYVNAGANYGYHTLLGAMLVEAHGRVFSFEANPHAYSLLRKSVYFNGLAPRTVLFPAAVYDKAGEMALGYFRDMMGGGGLDHSNDAMRRLAGGVHEPPSSDGIETLGSSPAFHPLREKYRQKPTDFVELVVPTVTLDETVGVEVETIDFLHMDIEGSEGHALLGGRRLIERSPNLQMIVEWSFLDVGTDEQREKFRQAVAMMVAERFKFYVISQPAGNAYTTPPNLTRCEPAALFAMPHCDLFIARA